MRTMSIGGGTARECPAAKAPFQTVATGGSDRVCDNRGNIISSRTHDGGYGVRVVDRINVVEKRQHGGFEWTGSAFPLRIPTTWKVRFEQFSRDAQHVMSLLSPRDVLALLIIGALLALVWSVLGPIAA